VAGLTVNLRESAPGRDPRSLADIYQLGTNGIFEWCQGLTLGRTITAEVHQRGALVGSAQMQLKDKVTYVKLLITPRP
jgi:hypothetical protein